MLSLLRSQPRSHGHPESAEPTATRDWIAATLTGFVGLGIVVVVILALVAGAMLAAFGPAAPLVTVPKVKGMSVKKAEERLELARLKMTVVNYEYNRNVKEGSVISTSPYEGKQVRAGRQVRAVISRGSRTVKVPMLKDLQLEEAAAKLTNNDLQIGETEKKTDDAPADQILSQTPAAGTVVNRKTKVNLLVSGGKDFSEFELADGKTFVFRTLKITVPQGKALQLVSVSVQGSDMDKSFLERLCRPGEMVEVDLYGPEGARVRVRLDDERVFSERL